jgi:hypothetical protein
MHLKFKLDHNHLHHKRGPSWSRSYLQLPVQPVSIITKDASSNPADGEVFSIPHYVIKVVSDLRQVGGFLRVLYIQFPSPIKLTATI